jgi:hypothetical protein
MFPTCSNIDLAGRNALSATALTISPPCPDPETAGGREQEYSMPKAIASDNPPRRTAGFPAQRWYVPRALGERGTSAPRSRILGAVARIAIALTLFGGAVALAACGGGGERQDADEPEADFEMDVTTAKFPSRQRLAETRDLTLEVENIGSEQIPDLAVTICVEACDADGSFSIRSDQPGLANPNRPVWILEQDYPKLLEPGISPNELDDEPSAGAEAVQTNTFSFGGVAPGSSVNPVWRVTAVKAGTYTLRYEIAAGLAGNAKAVTADGSPVKGSFVVTIADKPPEATVNEQGEVELKD